MQSIPAEKVPETAMSQDNILLPLEFLLAARRGVRMDPLFSELNVPEERNIHYHEQYSTKAGWTFLLLIFSMDLHLQRSGDSDSPKKSVSEEILQDLINSFYWTAGFVLLLYAARVYAKRYLSKKIPPHLDPLSYQHQFKSALDERGWQYREIVGRSLEDMEQIWSKDQTQVERFRVDGLLDSASNSVYDVVVILRKEGNVTLMFRAPIDGIKLPGGVLLT
ncbi:hypothetical protein N7490_000562 [Penicillium lividum]|nr:hypothetical protein N7490_000562 [Penicillium lividum]